MKIVKVTIRRGVEGEPKMVYPTRYNPYEIDRNGLGPLSVNGIYAYSGEIARGGSTETCLIMLPDALADAYATDVDMEIITSQEADDLTESWYQERESAKQLKGHAPPTPSPERPFRAMQHILDHVPQ